NLLIVAGLPFSWYAAYHKWRHRRTPGGDFAPGGASDRRQAVFGLRRRVRLGPRRHPCPLGAAIRTADPRGLAPTGVRWPRARRAGGPDGPPRRGGPDGFPRGTPLPWPDRRQSVQAALPRLGQPGADGRLLFAPPARAAGHARAVGHPPGDLRGLAPA